MPVDALAGLAIVAAAVTAGTETGRDAARRFTTATGAPAALRSAPGRIAERAGRATGNGARATGRAGAKAGRWAGQRATAAAGRRWDARRATAGVTPLIGPAHQPNTTTHQPSASMHGTTGALGRTRRTGLSPQAPFGPNRPFTIRSATPGPQGTPSQQPGGAGSATSPAPSTSTPSSIPVQKENLTVSARPRSANTAHGSSSYGPGRVLDLSQLDSAPESDSEHLECLLSLAAGASALSEALAEYEASLASEVGLDAVSFHGLAEAAEHFSEATTCLHGAARAFEETYEGIRETVASGVAIPKDARWFTGDA